MNPLAVALTIIYIAVFIATALVAVFARNPLKKLFTYISIATALTPLNLLLRPMLLVYSEGWIEVEKTVIDESTNSTYIVREVAPRHIPSPYGDAVFALGAIVAIIAAMLAITELPNLMWRRLK